MSSRRTLLYPVHEDLGAKFVEFAGWEMPVWYSGIVPEHEAVRSYAGIFDVSHMGEIFVSGPQALDALQYLTCNDLAPLEIGKSLYTAILNEQGGVVDDTIIYRLEADRYLVCVNASNREKDYQWFLSHNTFSDVQFEDKSDQYGLIAVQGPHARIIAARLFGPECTSLERFGHRTFIFNSVEVIVARTGYTGEDGVEVFCPNGALEPLWQEFLESDPKLLPIGLGARDSLRLEACYSLHGHEIADDISPYEAGLSWIVSMKKDFIGKGALEKQKKEGVPRRLIRFFVEGKAIARHGDRIHSPQGKEIGCVTSGTKTPTVGRAIGLGLVDVQYSQESDLSVLVRQKEIPIVTTKKPFYYRALQ